MTRDTRTYIRVHDGMPDHPKVEPLSDKAFRLLVSSWAWCSRHRTDGCIRASVWLGRGTARARTELVDAGLVEALDNGDVLVHDYLEHQRSAEEIAELSLKRAEAGSRGGRARASKQAKRQASARASAKQTASKTQADTETENRELQILGAEDGAKRRSDPLWDAVMAACGIKDSEITKSARGGYNRAVADLRSVGATPAMVVLRARRWAQMFPGATLTPNALAKHWSQLENGAGSNSDPRYWQGAS